uniref:Uncharacterized protein n=1 Tax=Strongyloides papillosus TaxID=174720 RepID=A0A0N5B7A4_STREA
MVDNDDVDVYMSKIQLNEGDNKSEQEVEEEISSVIPREQLQNLYLEDSSIKTPFSDPSTSSIPHSPKRQNIFKEIYLANKRRFSLPGKHLSTKKFRDTIEHLPNTASGISKGSLESKVKTGSFDNIPISTDNGTTTFLEHNHQPSLQNVSFKCCR